MVATHICGVDNTIADKISRMHVGDAWQLNLNIFN